MYEAAFLPFVIPAALQIAHGSHDGQIPGISASAVGALAGGEAVALGPDRHAASSVVSTGGFPITSPSSASEGAFPRMDCPVGSQYGRLFDLRRAVGSGAILPACKSRRAPRNAVPGTRSARGRNLTRAEENKGCARWTTPCGTCWQWPERRLPSRSSSPGWRRDFRGV